eukprot:scaffold114036_cov18-Tisochrysis_lutea.AAC.3
MASLPCLWLMQVGSENNNVIFIRNFTIQRGCSQIQWADAYYRKDIGWKDVARLKGARAFGRQAEQPETDDL